MNQLRLSSLKNRKKKKKKDKKMNNLRDLWDTIKYTKIDVMGVLEEAGREKVAKEFEE